jgi:phosphatidylinositol alpha-1,6-mannosyltransferase
VCWAHGEELAYVRSSRELQGLATLVYRRALAVIANSQNTANLLLEAGVRSDVIHVVRPGVDSNRFRPQAPGSSDLRHSLASGKDIVCLSVGRLQRRKGHDLVIQALAALGPVRSKIRYVIVGDGEERRNLESLVRQYGLETTVEFVGRVSAKDLPSYYAAADIFLQPNRIDGVDFEGFGIVFLEAAACGLPVIAGRSGGVSEAVADGVTGLLVSGTDAAELEQALLKLLSSAEIRHTMGTAGRARVESEFTWQRAADQVASVHRQVVDAR